MNGQGPQPATTLAAKIACLVEERGWNQEEFARQTGLNRQTARKILRRSPEFQLRNHTVLRCARALQLSVNELRSRPLDDLLKGLPCAVDQACRQTSTFREDAGFGLSLDHSEFDSGLRRLYEEATQPELLAWIERQPERAGRLGEELIDELLSLQGVGGPLTSFGVEHFVELLERKKRLLEQVHAVAGTEYLDVLEQFVAILYEKVQPYADRK